MAWWFPWVRIVPEYQRAAVFRLGRIRGFRGPGVIFTSPLLERLVLVDRRVVSVDVPGQECISRDNVPLKVTAVVYFRVQDPNRALCEVVDYEEATLQVAQTTLRSVIGQSTMDELLVERLATAAKLQEILDQATEAWGVKVTRVEIKDLEVPDTLKRAMARAAEAERERRAMVIRAMGEREAAEQWIVAARKLDMAPRGFEMRFLQTLAYVAERGNTVVFARDGEGLPQAVAAAAQVRTKTAREP
jgi:regulator of protease activity HflC (stomatin/prohibitin superfamily)